MKNFILGICAEYSKITKTGCANGKFDKCEVLQLTLQFFTKMSFFEFFEFFAQNTLFWANHKVVALLTRKMIENTSLCIFAQNI